MKTAVELIEAAHLLVAAVRLYRHREGIDPSFEQLAEFAALSNEVTHHLVRKLVDHGVFGVVESAFEGKVMLLEPEKIQDMIQSIEDAPDLDDHMEAIGEAKKKLAADVGKKMKSDYVDEEKKSFADELQQRIKDPGKFKKANPLDALGKGGESKENPLDSLLGKKEKKANPLDDLLKGK